MILDDMKEELQKASKIGIVTHENPDGDAIGSALAMYMALKAQNKAVDVIIPEYAKVFEFFPVIQESIRQGKPDYDLVVALDCSNEQRLADPAKSFEKANKTIQIDHHVVNSMYADYDYVDPVAPACSQILIKVLQYWQMDINKEIGTCLLAGIITDTGGFQYEGVSAETFEIVAWLLGKGINISSIYKKVFQTMSKTRFELTKLAMSRIQFYEEGKIAFTYITKDDERNIGTDVGDYEGCVEIGRNIEGVEVSVFLREIDNGGYKVSMRSNEYVNVSDICLMFGGGGHIKAAGCKITTGSLEQIRDKIIAQTKVYLK